MSGARLLAVHAHPDDETLATGVTLAHHARRGDDVHVLTCTLGEEGEVIPPDLAHLEGAEGDPLAEHRLGEWRAALDALGAHGHLLGATGPSGRPTYRDSGMVGSAAAAHPRALAAAPVEQVAALVREVVERLRPDVVVTYDETGGYGHPDHVAVHRACVAALAGMPRASGPSGMPRAGLSGMPRATGASGRRPGRPRLMVALTPRSWAVSDRAWLAGHPEATGGWRVPGEGEPFAPSVVDDALVTHAVLDPFVVSAQVAALRAHATQVTLGEQAPEAPGVERVYALSNDIAALLRGREGYAELDVDTGRLLPGPQRGHDDDAERPGLLEEVGS